MIFKLDNVSDLSMARWAAAEGFSYITFNFERDSIYFISPQNASQICGWISGPKVVVRISIDELNQIQDIYKILKFDVLEMDLSTFQTMQGFETFPVILRTGKDTFELALSTQNSNPQIIALSLEESSFIFDKEYYPKCLLPNADDASKFGCFPLGVHLNAGRQNEPEFELFDFFEKSRYTWSKTVV